MVGRKGIHINRKINKVQTLEKIIIWMAANHNNAKDDAINEWINWSKIEEMIHNVC